MVHFGAVRYVSRSLKSNSLQLKIKDYILYLYPLRASAQLTKVKIGKASGKVGKCKEQTGLGIMNMIINLQCFLDRAKGDVGNHSQEVIKQWKDRIEAVLEEKDAKDSRSVEGS